METRYVASVTGGPTAKAFNIDFASLFGQVAEARVRPGNLWSGDDEARSVVDRLGLDAGFDAIHLGDLGMAAAEEGLAGTMFAIVQSGLGQFVYRMASPRELWYHASMARRRILSPSSSNRWCTVAVPPGKLPSRRMSTVGCRLSVLRCPIRVAV